MSLKGLKGGPQLDRFLSTLPAKLQRNVMRGGMRAGAVVVRDAAREKITAQTEESGELRRNVKVSSRARGRTVSAKVKLDGDHAAVGVWMEYGVQPHSLAKGAKVASGKKQHIGIQHPGIDPQPFLTPALDENAAAAVNAVGRYIRKRLTKEGLDAPELQADEE